MLLQSLLLIATLALLGSVLLTSTLVTAKSAFHAMVMRQSRSAMTDATASFISWAQDNIEQNGIDRLSEWALTPPKLGPRPACGESRPAQNSHVAIDCKLYRTVSWTITGYTNVDSIMPASTFVSQARNLATAQKEQRVSATVNISITDATGLTAYARQSRELTLRMFHAFPHVAVSAERDITSEAGSIASAEGDTAGYTKQDNGLVAVSDGPDQALPANYTSTVLLTTINCSNSINNSFQDAQLDNNQVAFAPVRPFGNLAWAYEVPCKPLQQINIATAPSQYQTPSDNVYGNKSTTNESWLKKDENLSSFAH